MTEKEVIRLGIRQIPDNKANQSKLKFEKITFALNNPIQIDYVIKVLESEFCDTSQKNKYLYICHDKDENEGELVKTHYHFIVWGNPRRFKDWADCFSIPNDPDNVILPSMICKVMNIRGMTRYLIHKDNPEKFQYDKELVHGSPKGLAYFKESLIDRQNLSFDDEVKDFYHLRTGQMKPRDFLKKYSYYYARESFSSRLRIYSTVFDQSNSVPYFKEVIAE